MTIDTERLIAEVRARPALWDMRKAAYKDRDSKQSAWVEVARAMFDNYDDSTQEEKERAVKSVLQRWKSARDQYVRLRAHIFKKGAKNKMKYIFANEMSFLDPVTNLQKLPPPPSQLLDNRTMQNSASSIEEIQTVTLKSTTTSQVLEEAPLKRRKRNTEKITQFEKELLSILRHAKNQSASDEDVAFFNSLLPTVRLLDLRQKLQFRSQVLQLLTPFTVNLQQPPSLLHKTLTSQNQPAQSVVVSSHFDIPNEFQSTSSVLQNMKQEISQIEWPSNSVLSPESVLSYDSTSSNDENSLHVPSPRFKREKEEDEDNGCSEIEEHFEFDFKKL